MASRPSKRIRHEVEDLNPNITPMMNLMVVLIPLLLTTAEFVRLGIIEINLPPTMDESTASLLTEHTENRLNLAITITDQGFYISSTQAILSGENLAGPTIPMIQQTNGEFAYNYRALSEKLWEIKQRLRELIDSGTGIVYPDSNQIIITAEPNVVYQTVVKTMAAARNLTIYKENEGLRIIDRREVLFDNISLSPGIF
jgi:biopolymer transport protein ExbD